MGGKNKMYLKFILLIASLLLVCIASSDSKIIPVFRNRKLILSVLQVNEGEEGEIHTRKEKQISVNFSRSPPAKGWICCDD
ncbi:hypothetical protein N665_4226s0003 [Sinapis alba]|nr:hypothetical protein N665_4226s0003 [Sinapis alba]